MIISDQDRAAPSRVNESDRPLSCYPAALGRLILVQDSAGIRVINVAEGTPAISAEGLIYRNESAADEQQQEALPPMATAAIAYGYPRLTLNIVDQLAFARVGEFPTSHAAARGRGDSNHYVVGLDLRREGLLTVRLRRTMLPGRSTELQFATGDVCSSRFVIAERHRRCGRVLRCNHEYRIVANFGRFSRYAGRRHWQ